MVKDEAIPVKCVFCGGEARIIHFDRNMYYCVCSNPSCKKHDKFAYLGRTEGNAIEQWNFMNRNYAGRKRNKDAGGNIQSTDA